MNMEFIISNASVILVVVAVICTLISVITEFTKEIGILNKIPTALQVLAQSHSLRISHMRGLRSSGITWWRLSLRPSWWRLSAAKAGIT